MFGSVSTKHTSLLLVAMLWSGSTAGVAAADSIIVAGKSIPRLEDPAVHIDNQEGIDALFAPFVAGAPVDFRTVEAADDAVDLGFPKLGRLGRVAYVRPGVGNIMFSPASIYLLAQHFKTVVLLYSNMTDPEPGATDLRRVYELEGVPIPSAIQKRVRIFAIGSPKFNVISARQQSDTTLEQLEILRSSGGFFRSGFKRGRVGWFFAHSQGMIDAVMTDHRLRSAGLPSFDRIIGIAGAVKGGRLIESEIGPLLIGGAEAAAGEQGRIAFETVDRTATIANLIDVLEIPGPPFAQELNLDIRLISRTFAGFGGVLDSSAPQGNARQGLIDLTDIPDGDGLVKPNDGVEDFDSTTIAQHNLVFEQVDHIGIIEDPSLMRAMLETIVDALWEEYRH